MSGKFFIELTMSQKMALTDALVEHIRCPDSTEVYVNYGETPAVETTIGELIRLVTEAKFFHNGGLIRGEPANENAGPKKDVGYQWPGKARQG